MSEGAIPRRIEYLYGIDAGHYDADDVWREACVVKFPITRKTARRIYYRSGFWRLTERSRRERFVDRQTLERDGEVTRRSAGWWEPDCTVYRDPPELPERKPAASLAELKTAMAAAHPDAGGSEAAFIAARQRYTAAREREKRKRT